LEEATALIEEKQKAEAQRVIKKFDEEPELQVLNGRFGPYIAYKKKNYKIPENIEPADLTVEACFKLMEVQKAKDENRKARYNAKKK
jgi:DNA topoisomerase-1